MSDLIAAYNYPNEEEKKYYKRWVFSLAEKSIMNWLKFNPNSFGFREQIYAMGLVSILQQAVICSTGFSASEKTYPIVKWEILLKNIS